MKRFLLSLLMLTTLSFFLSGQTTREDEARDDLKYSSTSQDRLRQQSDFGGQLWYGAGAQLGFSSFNGTAFSKLASPPS
jgi:hypothetical protein